MANLPCMTDDGNAAVFVGTALDSGDAIQLCPDCLLSWCVTMVAALTGASPERILAAATSEPDAASSDGEAAPAGDPAGAEAEQDPTPPASRNGRTRRASTDQPTAIVAGGDEPPAASTDAHSDA